MSRPCMLNDGKTGYCEEEAAPGSPFCYEHMKRTPLNDSSFAYCEIHEVVHLKHFQCPACYLHELGYRMDVNHDLPVESCGRYIHELSNVYGKENSNG